MFLNVTVWTAGFLCVRSGHKAHPHRTGARLDGCFGLAGVNLYLRKGIVIVEQAWSPQILLDITQES